MVVVEGPELSKNVLGMFFRRLVRFSDSLNSPLERKKWHFCAIFDDFGPNLSIFLSFPLSWSAYCYVFAFLNQVTQRAVLIINDECTSTLILLSG